MENRLNLLLIKNRIKFQNKLLILIPNQYNKSINKQITKNQVKMWK